MEAIGNLTGGLAHDFNNLLAIIIGNLDSLHVLVGDDAQELAQDALTAALRGADLTHRLLAFARRQPLSPERLDINRLIAGVTRLLGRLLGQDIEMMLTLGSAIWPVLADPAQLEAAITNLATNARDAMARGGRLRIVTSNHRLGAHTATQVADIASGDYVVIEVSDTGTGMSADLMERIFEPFFTTKEQGKGTGLGLSMVFGFVKQSGGHVSVASEPGRGTTFRLFLPRLLDNSVDHAVIEGAPQLRGGSESVLVVEDTAELRRIVVRQLIHSGYQVLEAEHARAALALIESGVRIDLLLTDIVMPGELDGEELAKLVRDRHPNIRVLLTSGFPDAAGHGFTPSGPIRMLGKPYRHEELIRTVREVLDC